MVRRWFGCGPGVARTCFRIRAHSLAEVKGKWFPAVAERTLRAQYCREPNLYIPTPTLESTMRSTIITDRTQICRESSGGMEWLGVRNYMSLGK